MSRPKPFTTTQKRREGGEEADPAADGERSDADDAEDTESASSGAAD
ncbi:hypothetical protein [Halorubrum amylolyticum]|nr:hypothetical protein [Halorubrum amylolyticum]